jgi:hypothetical protein
METLKQKLSSRKFWVGIAAIAIIVINSLAGLGINTDDLWKVAVAYIIGEGIVDAWRVPRG